MTLNVGLEPDMHSWVLVVCVVALDRKEKGILHQVPSETLRSIRSYLLVVYPRSKI